ncbi:hypothetical protein CR513_05475, partial [Mucuna pruriens]
MSGHQRSTIAVLPRRMLCKADSLGTLNVSPYTRLALVLFDAHKMTKNSLIKLASLPGTQVLLRSSEPLHAFDLEIERTLHHLRKVRHTITLNSSSSNSILNFENSKFTTDESNFFEHQEARSMENNDRTLKELATPDVVYQPWCIQCPPLEPAHNYELKFTLIHLLPKSSQALKGVPCGLFHNEATGDTERPHQDEDVSILPRWSCKRLVVSAAGSLQYLGRYEAHVPGEILPSIQNSDNKEGDLWDQATLWFDNDGPKYDYVASGGALMDKTLAATRHLISNMASNTHLPSANTNPLQEIEPNHPESVGSIGPTIRTTAIPANLNRGSYATTRKHASEPRQLSTAKSKILGAIVPTTTVVENATTRKLTIFGGFGEAISSKQPGVLADCEL